MRRYVLRSGVALMLRAPQTVQAGLFGASVLGPNEIYTKLKAYKASLLSKYPDGNLCVLLPPCWTQDGPAADVRRRAARSSTS